MVWLDSDALKPPLRAKTLTSWSEVNRIVYPFDRHWEGVDQWNCILGCAIVGHRNIWSHVLSHVVTRFPPVFRKWSFELWVYNLLLWSRCRLWSVSHFGVLWFIFKPSTTLLYIYLGSMHDLFGFRRSEAPKSGETLTNWSEVNRIIYPFDRHRVGVD